MSHHAQTKQHTKLHKQLGHITHNEYNTKEAIPVMGRGGL
jgi:hypothetical protein